MSQDGIDVPLDGAINRREFMKLVSASLALAGLEGCVDPPAHAIVPYTTRPADVIPGVARSYATAMTVDGRAVGLLARSHEGRPTKLEGNPEHPFSLGAAGVFEQASVLQLYDPQRARAVTRGGAPSSWEELERLASGDIDGARMRVLMEPQSSPLLLEQLARLRAARPGIRVTSWSPLQRVATYRGAAIAFGRPLEPIYDFTKARVVLALDADFLATAPGALRWARDFAVGRRLDSPAGEPSRLYAVEAGLSPTGMLADHRLRRRRADVVAVAAAVLAELLRQGADQPAPAGLKAAVERLAARAGSPEWVRAVARDLRRVAGAGLVVVGDAQPAEVHVLGHALNLVLGNVGPGRPLALAEPAVEDPLGEAHPLSALVEELRAGAVDTLLVLEGNPIYSAPAELDLAAAFARAPRSIHLSLHANETSAACTWLAPATHFLEAWGDGRALDGTVTLQQPLISPLFGGRPAAELVALFAGERAPRSHNLLRGLWTGRLGGGAAVDAALQRGLVDGTANALGAASPSWDACTAALERASASAVAGGLELCFDASPQVWDGRFANTGWLLELPDPATKLTWTNAAVLGPRTARQLGVSSGDVVELSVAGRAVEAAALVLPGHADDSVSLALGFGRAGTETIAAGVGVSGYRLRTAATPSFALGLTIRPTGRHRPLPLTQIHNRQEGRPLALTATLAEWRKNPDLGASERGPVPSLNAATPMTGNQWAMSIDLGLCTGCSACMVACQAENNVPIVGATGVLRSREMHWLRIDRYFVGDEDDPEVVNEPMACQHCEKAPCEYVCPVNATVHSPDGLNEMVYNRCIGTRFCSNNCPYKVRRFNFFDYVDDSLRKLQKNPNVTVRERGVMEKCTYCVQRIRGAEIQASCEGRPIRPGEVVTACQQACPTGAIVFGNLADADADATRWRTQGRAFAVLNDQGTRPRTMYLAQIKNKNPEVE